MLAPLCSQAPGPDWLINRIATRAPRRAGISGGRRGPSCQSIEIWLSVRSESPPATPGKLGVERMDGWSSAEPTIYRLALGRTWRPDRRGSGTLGHHFAVCTDFGLSRQEVWCSCRWHWWCSSPAGIRLPHSDRALTPRPPPRPPPRPRRAPLHNLVNRHGRRCAQRHRYEDRAGQVLPSAASGNVCALYQLAECFVLWSVPSRVK